MLWPTENIRDQEDLISVQEAKLSQPIQQSLAIHFDVQS